MLGAIAGDIIGSRFEGHSSPPRDFDLFHRDCRFTDDSVCSLAVAEALLGEQDFASCLRAFVRRHPNRGYGGMFLRWAMTDGAPAYGSWGNGAPMRVSAVGWLATDENETRRLAASQAAVSHDHAEAIIGAQAVALAIHMARREHPADALRQRLVEDFGYDLTPDSALVGGRFDVSSAGTVPPAVVAAIEADSWETAVRTAVGLGGDTDTLACIAGAVAEAIHGLPSEIAKIARGYLTDDLSDVMARFETAVEDLP